ncbi:MAG: EFR1 family ferrodoxin [Candidatus Thorarchaeota archaeon]|jgi:ferredoxin
MSTRIYYFSGTGNSLMIARAIAAELGDTEIIRISDTIKEGAIDSCTRVGLVFPVYYGGLPLIVQKFLPLLESFRDCYIFGVANHAGGPGRAISQLGAELQQIGLSLSSGFRLRMPQNFTIGYDAPTEGEATAILNNSLSKIPDIVDYVKGKRVRTSTSDSSAYSGQSRRYHRFIAGVNESDTEFWCEDSCTECEACVRVCSVHNIVMKDGRPSWLGKCEQCLACVNWCPAEAIQHGRDSLGRGRYTNPRVIIDDFEF